MNNKQFNGIEAIIANDLRGVKAGYHTLEEVEEKYGQAFDEFVNKHVVQDFAIKVGILDTDRLQAIEMFAALLPWVARANYEIISDFMTAVNCHTLPFEETAVQDYEACLLHDTIVTMTVAIDEQLKEVYHTTDGIINVGKILGIAEAVDMESDADEMKAEITAFAKKVKEDAVKACNEIFANRQQGNLIEYTSENVVSLMPAYAASTLQ